MSALTPRELDIARLIVQERTYKEIAFDLRAVSPDAIKSSVEHIRKKLKVRSRVGVAIWYVRTFPSPDKL